MGRSWATLLALRLAGTMALDEIALFQSEFSFGLEPMDPSPGAPAAPSAPGATMALPNADIMPGGADINSMRQTVKTLNATMIALRNDTTNELLNAHAAVVSDVYADAIKRMVADVQQTLVKSRGQGELDKRKIFGEMMAMFNASFLALNDTVPAADADIADIVPDGLRPSTIYRPQPTVQMMMALLNNTEDFLERTKQRDDNLTSAEFCVEATHFSQGLNAINRIVDYSLEKQCQSKTGNSQENPEYNPLVLIAPDVIRPLQVYMDSIVAGGQKIHNQVLEMKETFANVATGLLLEEIPSCQLTKAKLNGISSARSRTPFGVFLGMVAATLWLSMH